MNTAKNIISEFSDIIPIWQPVGYSTYRITMDLAQKLGKKTAQTGVLDPLAEGVIIVLAGEERLKKIEYAGWRKTYEFDIAFGLSTDSYDGMGIVTGENFSPNVTEEKTQAILKNLIGKYDQRVPLYSAKKLNGKRLFDYPKQGIVVDELPMKSGEIYSIELLNLTEISLHTLIDTIIEKISLVKHGEFRQEETISGWRDYTKKTEDKKIQVATIKVEISRGMYVRSLSQDIATKLGTIGFVSKLIRTQNGEYSKQNCYMLNQLL